MSNECYRVMKKIWNYDDNTEFMRKVRRDNDDPHMMICRTGIQREKEI